MLGYVIIETDDGLAVAEVPEQSTPEDVASSRAARLVDGELFKSYDDAYDALLAIPVRPEED